MGTQITDPQRLSRRDREILKDVIRGFILTGEPVSSRSVAKRSRHGLSPATIRNVMADLEESGYLTQPHTSAGRVPTSVAYHLYVDSLMRNRKVPARERRYIDQNLAGAASRSEELLSTTSQLLSELSQQVGVVVTPALGGTVLKSVDFLSLSGSRVLCVVVSTTGFVDNKVIEISRPILREELVRISNYLTENFSGLTLREIRESLLRRMTETKAQVDRLLANTLVLARQALEDTADSDLLVEGTSKLLSQPELADVERVRRLLDTFEDKARLVELLNKVLEGRGVRVLIGEDSDLTEDLDFSLVATTYGVGEKALGTLGIFGPSRMEYPRMVPLVNYLGETLSRALEATLAEDADEAVSRGGERAP